MLSTDPFQAEKQERKIEKGKAQTLFDEYKIKKLTLKRIITPIFALPVITNV